MLKLILVVKEEMEGKNLDLLRIKDRRMSYQFMLQTRTTITIVVLQTATETTMNI